MPKAGLLNSSFRGSVHLFDFIIITENITVARHNEPFSCDIYETAKHIHYILAYVFTVFIFIYVVATLIRHIIDKGNPL